MANPSSHEGVSPALLVAVRRDGACVCRPDEEPAIPLGWAELRIIERLAAGDGVELAPDGAADLLSTLRAEGLLLTEPLASAPAERPLAPRRPTEPLEDQVATATPLVFRPCARGFESLDHEGRLRARLDATELSAFACLAATMTRTEALAHHQQEAGDEALSPEAFESLVLRLAEVGLVGPHGTAEPGGRENQDAKAAYAHWHRMGKAADRAVAAHDRAEREREPVHGPRTKVIPIDRGQPMPLGLAMVVAHAMTWNDGRLNDRYQFVPAWFTRPHKPPVDEDRPAVYLFSNYVWQHRRNLEISERIKAESPASVTIHGGPDTPKYDRDVEAYSGATLTST